MKRKIGFIFKILLIGGALFGAVFIYLTLTGSGDALTRSAQEQLSRLGFYGGEINGLPSERYLDAVACFKEKNGLDENGELDETAQSLLFGETALGDPDEMLLARTISGFEGADMQLAAAAALVNRTESGSYPSSLALVCADFNGASGQATPQSLWAARRALSGFDPVGGATEILDEAPGKDYLVVTVLEDRYFCMPY